MPPLANTALNTQVLGADAIATSKHKRGVVTVVIRALTIGVMLTAVSSCLYTSSVRTIVALSAVAQRDEKFTARRPVVQSSKRAFHRALQASSIRRVDLDETTLSKAGHIATPSHRSLNSLGTFQPLKLMHGHQAAWRGLQLARAEGPVVYVASVASALAVRVASLLEAPSATKKPIRSKENFEVQRLLQMHSQEVQDKMKGLRADPELKPMFDRIENGGLGAIAKYPAFLHEVGERLGEPPVVSMEEAQRAMANPEVQRQLAAAMALSKNMQTSVAAIRKDPESDVPALKESASNWAEEGAQSRREWKGGTASTERARRVVAAMAKSEDMQEKIRALRDDLELKHIFTEMEKEGPAIVMEYLNDQRFLHKVSKRLRIATVKVDEPHLLADTHVKHSELNVATRKLDNRDRTEGTLLMLAITMLWGTNFPAVKAVGEAGLPESFDAAARFSIAALALLPMLGDPRNLQPELVRGGLHGGVWLAVGYIAQALALHDLPAGTVAFIASLQVIMVPLVETFRGGICTPRLALAALLCVGGVGLLESGGMAGVAGDSAMGTPDVLFGATVLAFLQPVAFSVNILINMDVLQKVPDSGSKLSALQLLSNAAVALAWCIVDASGVFEGGAAHGGSCIDLEALQQPAVIASILWTGLISTALTNPLEMRALGKLPVTDSTMIVATEPLWAAGFASLFLAEHLETSELIGGSLILLGCISNTLCPVDLGTGIKNAFAPQRRHLRGAKEPVKALTDDESQHQRSPVRAKGLKPNLISAVSLSPVNSTV
eukprot:gnl/TRDRNA2_/TRDRNA2_133678_c1_seq1.p1 gnl/TRDRNA2_/TRDRNA2_133678_c1~~gnl/TRDRNA2_/TRDRNA2_133678_c1_seq1.p1  ORF type:complete len:802 (-),score=114.79 gnl/TRDRNA2_/TRDRNA2_133678_c1_seq1:686-3022(-)